MLDDAAGAQAEVVPGDRPGSFVLRMSGMDQSCVDLDDPTRLDFAYVRRIGDLLDACAPPGTPLRIVHVGGAAMTLPRYVAATRPRSAQLVLEPAEEVTALVRRELPLPPRSGIKVRPVDGRTGLAALRDAYADVVVVDAFADARVPPSLVTPGAQADLARALAPDGVAVLNLTDRSPFAWTRRVVAGLRGHLPEVALVAEQATLRGRRGGNLVLAASRRALPVAELRARASGTAAPYRVLDARAVSDAFGGGRPFTEEDAEASPRPDAG